VTSAWKIGVAGIVGWLDLTEIFGCEVVIATLQETELERGQYDTPEMHGMDWCGRHNQGMAQRKKNSTKGSNGSQALS
jgi:hypothetical protein